MVTQIYRVVDGWLVYQWVGLPHLGIDGPMSHMTFKLEGSRLVVLVVLQMLLIRCPHYQSDRNCRIMIIFITYRIEEQNSFYLTNIRSYVLIYIMLLNFAHFGSVCSVHHPRSFFLTNILRSLPLCTRVAPFVLRLHRTASTILVTCLSLTIYTPSQFVLFRTSARILQVYLIHIFYLHVYVGIR